MTVKTKTQLSSSKDSLFANNTSGDITPTDLRDYCQHEIDSYLAISNGATAQTVSSAVEFTDITFNSLPPFNSFLQVLNAYNNSDQAPSATDTATQITFGASQFTGSDPVQLATGGTITFNDTGKYVINLALRVGRTTATNVAHFITALKINGSYDETISVDLIDSQYHAYLITKSYFYNATAADTFSFFQIRDSAGENNGGLYGYNPTLSGVANIPSAQVKIYKMVDA